MAVRIIEGLSNFDPDMKLDAGLYLFQINESSFGTFERSGREYLELDGELVEGPIQTSGIEVAGRKQRFRLGLVQPNDKPNTKNLMGGKLRTLNEALGYEDDTIDTERYDGQIVCVKLVTQKDSDFLDLKRVYNSAEFVVEGASGPSTGSTSSGGIY
jgi:hypothetical protein